MSDMSFPDDLPADEMGDYLRLYLDETGEQLDGLVETLLSLESDPSNAPLLDEAFRLLHSIKGSSALLGLDRITALTHHLESHFVQLRSGRRPLDAETMAVVLRCIDFLRASNEKLRRGEPLESAGDLLGEVQRLAQSAPVVSAALPPAPPVKPPPPAVTEPAPESASQLAPGRAEPSASSPSDTARQWRIALRFVPGLVMVELKAQLVVARLAAIGEILAVVPPCESLPGDADPVAVVIDLVTAAERAEIELAADADGVDHLVISHHDGAAVEQPMEPALAEAIVEEPPETAVAVAGAYAPSPTPTRRADPATPAAGLTETLRIDVDRLDVLLNQAGELIVNRARIAELLAALGPLFRKSGHAGRSSLVADALSGIMHALEQGDGVDRASLAADIGEQVAVLRQQTLAWNEARKTFSDLSAAADQLTRVSKSLQHGVLNTRMVPVGPLFARFKRSVRDIATELGKKVSLELVGEKTELDKRMIDELGDPLNHLIRNSIDHGIESSATRVARGKPETATVRLSAAHRGNNVIITVSDDGGGIDVERVRQTAVDRGLVTQAAAAGLAEAEVIDLIWEPGFSTKAAVSDISGRGVGMDIVRTKVKRLNGSIDVASTPGVGTTFTIRLPLTLTITRCMLFKVPHAVFAAPIENVREIVRLADHRCIDVQGRRLCDIRGEFLPLVGIEDLFAWHGDRPPADGGENVVVLQSQSRSIGLRVDMLLGGHDIVVKALDENYDHIRGLGGASILGDGSVCLLLDVATCVDIAQPQRGNKPVPA
jgi:two-component system chemotaxis sensor kinase CheA